MADVEIGLDEVVAVEWQERWPPITGVQYEQLAKLQPITRQEHQHGVDAVRRQKPGCPWAYYVGCIERLRAAPEWHEEKAAPRPRWDPVAEAMEEEG